MELYQAYLRLLVAFPLVVVLAYLGLRFFLARFAPVFGLGRRVQVLERAALNSRTFLYVVRVGDEYLLLGLTGSNIVLLKDLGPAWGRDFYAEPEAAGPGREQKKPSFALLLKELRGAGGDKDAEGKNWRSLLPFVKKRAGGEEEFASLTRNYKLRKVKEEDTPPGPSGQQGE